MEGLNIDVYTIAWLERDARDMEDCVTEAI